MPGAEEINFDGLVGPTHNYAGLAHGNLASQQWKQSISNPRQAALEGLQKMKFLADLGVAQAVLPPQERPAMAMLRRLGFSGNDAQVIEAAARHAPALLAACYSASSMWAANAATVSPSADTADGRVHFTPANLASHFHRSIEAVGTSRILKAIFNDESCFAHHEPLPAGLYFGDEGAANHMRLAQRHAVGGIEIFVFGRRAFSSDQLPARFLARQTLEASQAIARLHALDPNRCLFLKQNPAAIDAGVFHNDVVAVANEHALLFHADAFEDPNAADLIREAVGRIPGLEPTLIAVGPEQLSLQEVVGSYLFNSQLVTLPDSGMALICPMECHNLQRTKAFLDQLVESDTPIRSVHYVNVRQSMQNGGGPACLRLRVVLTDREQERMHQGVVLTDDLYAKLTAWVEHHYRRTLAPDDLSDPHLIGESRAAMDELSTALSLGQIYDFQR